MGIEPTSPAWEAGVLPMNYTCERKYYTTMNSKKQENFPCKLIIDFPEYAKTEKDPAAEQRRETWPGPLRQEIRNPFQSSHLLLFFCTFYQTFILLNPQIWQNIRENLLYHRSAHGAAIVDALRIMNDTDRQYLRVVGRSKSQK